MKELTETQSVPARLDEIEHQLKLLILVLQQMGVSQPSSKYLTIKEAADFVCMAIPTVYGKVSSRQIPHYKRGKRLYFNTMELSEWLEAGRRKTTNEMNDEAVEVMAKKHKSKYGNRHE